MRFHFAEDMTMAIAEIPPLAELPTETRSLAWGKAIVCGILGTTIVTIAWGCLRAYTEVLETRNLRLIVASLLWTLGIILPVYGWVSDWVLKVSVVRAFPINLFASALGVIHVLGGDWIASNLSDKKLGSWDGVSLTAL